MKKRLLLLLVMAMALPLAAFADDVSFSSTGGTLTGNSAGLTLVNATLTQVSGLGGSSFTGSNLGTVSFSTGDFGPIANVNNGGAILAGGTITITGNGADGIPTGTLFSGTFSTGGTWGYVLQPDGTYLYTLNANVTGVDGNGNGASGTIVFSIDNGTKPFAGYTNASGTSSVNVAVPEPGELSFLGMGLIGLIGAIRRKVSC